MSSGQHLREFINERLTVAAEEIFTKFEKTIVQYEAEIDRQRRLLDTSWKPRRKLTKRSRPQQHDCREEEVVTEHQPFTQEMDSSLDQDKPEPPHTKEDQEELEPSHTEEDQEEPEPPHTEEDQEEPEPPHTEEDQEEPEPPHTEEDREELEPLQMEEDQGEVHISQQGEQLVLKDGTDTVVQSRSEHEEILKVSEKSSIQYEEEPDHQSSLIVMPQIKLHRIDVPHRHVFEEKVIADQQLFTQEMISSLDQREPEPLQMEEDQEEPEPLQMEEDQEEPEPVQMEEDPEEPEDQEEPEPHQIEEEQEELEPLQMEEDQEEVHISQQGEQLVLKDGTDTVVQSRCQHEEILKVSEKSSIQYEEEPDHQSRLLNLIVMPQIKLHRIDVPHRHVFEEKVLADQQRFTQEMISSLDQREPEPLQMEEDQEEPELVQMEEDQEEPEPVQMEEDPEEPEPPLMKKHQKDPEPPQTKEYQKELEPPLNKEEPEPSHTLEDQEKLEPQNEEDQVEPEDQEEPEPPHTKEDQEEPEPPHTEEDQEELEPPHTKEDQEELEPPHTEEDQEELEPLQMEEDQEELEPLQMEEDQEEVHISQQGEQLVLKDGTDTVVQSRSEHEEILKVSEKSSIQYEEEPDHQSSLIVMPQIKLRRIDVSHQGCRDEPEPPQMKEDQEQQSTNQEGDQLGLKQETETFKATPNNEDGDHMEPEPNSNQLFFNNSLLAERHVQEANRDVFSASAINTEQEMDSSNRSHTNDEGKASSSDIYCKNDKSIKSVNCDICGKAFKNKSEMKKHHDVHAEKPHICNICGKSFRSSRMLTVHERTHEEKPPYACETCGKWFTDFSKLVSHKKFHSERRPYSCKSCSKRFINNFNLTTHMRMHTGEKPFCCPTCGKRFNQRGNMNVHMKTHTGL